MHANILPLAHFSIPRQRIIRVASGLVVELTAAQPSDYRFCLEAARLPASFDVAPHLRGIDPDRDDPEFLPPLIEMCGMPRKGTHSAGRCGTLPCLLSLCHW